MSNRNIPINHEYLKYLADDAFLSCKDIQEIFGFSNYTHVHTLIKRGLFPPHDRVHNPNIMFNKKRQNLFQWKKQTVLDAIKKINEERA